MTLLLTPAPRLRRRVRTASAWVERVRGARTDLLLLDRDGVLLQDAAHHGDPRRLRIASDVRRALDVVRAAGTEVGVVACEPGLTSGAVSPDDLDAVDARLVELLGPLVVVEVCPHPPAEGCPCRHPEPGLVTRACADAGTVPARTVLVSDCGSAVAAAAAAGARGLLVVTSSTRPVEMVAAGRLHTSLTAAIAEAGSRRRAGLA